MIRRLISPLFLAVFFSLTTVHAQEVTLSSGSENKMVITSEQAQDFYNKLSSRKRTGIDQYFWTEISSYFQKLPELVKLQDSSNVDLRDFIFPMAHENSIKLMVKHEDLIGPELLFKGTISSKVVDKMILRDSVQMIYDYYYAMKNQQFNLPGILATLGVKPFAQDQGQKTIGQTIHAFDINEKYLGSKFLNNHSAVSEWIELLGEIPLKDGLDLAFNEKFNSSERHPLLGGKREQVHSHFAEKAGMFRAVKILSAQVENDALVYFSKTGNLKNGTALSIYLCSVHLKLNENVSKEFQTYCDYVLYKAHFSKSNKSHSQIKAFDHLDSRHDLRF